MLNVIFFIFDYLRDLDVPSLRVGLKRDGAAVSQSPVKPLLTMLVHTPTLMLTLNMIPTLFPVPSVCIWVSVCAGNHKFASSVNVGVFIVHVWCATQTRPRFNVSSEGRGATPVSSTRIHTHTHIHTHAHTHLRDDCTEFVLMTLLSLVIKYVLGIL